MYIVREHFVTKPGQASKLAALLKEVSAMVPHPNPSRILTDVTGKFNRVIMETEVASLADFEARMKEYGSNAELKEKMKDYTQLWASGGREILRVV